MNHFLCSTRCPRLAYIEIDRSTLLIDQCQEAALASTKLPTGCAKAMEGWSVVDARLGRQKPVEHVRRLYLITETIYAEHLHRGLVSIRWVMSDAMGNIGKRRTCNGMVI